MKLFKSRYEKELDVLIGRVEMNMANNYKDNAQADFRDYEAALERIIGEGHLKEKEKARYEDLLRTYRDRLVGFTHNDQKPYWTKDGGKT